MAEASLTSQEHLQAVASDGWSRYDAGLVGPDGVSLVEPLPVLVPGLAALACPRPDLTSGTATGVSPSCPQPCACTATDQCVKAYKLKLFTRMPRKSFSRLAPPLECFKACLRLAPPPRILDSRNCNHIRMRRYRDSMERRVHPLRFKLARLGARRSRCRRPMSLRLNARAI